MNTVLEVKDLKTGYEGKVLMEGIDLTLSRGEIFSVIGPNGAGKSTLLKTLSGALPRISGSILIRGRELKSFSLKELSGVLSLLLTDRVKSEYMTGRDMIVAGRFPFTGNLGILRKEDKEAVKGVIELTGVSGLTEKLFNRMSDGEKQRILFARALCQEPEILIMDEPMSYLDIRYKLQMMELLKKLSKERGLTVIMAVHEAALAFSVSHKIMMLKDHRVFGMGTAAEMGDKEKIKSLYDLDENGWALINRGFVIE